MYRKRDRVGRKAVPLIEGRLVGIGLFLGAVQEQDPLEEFTGSGLLVGRGREEDLEFPEATRSLGPRVRGHERPLVKAVVRVRVERSLGEEQRARAKRTCQEDDRVSATRRLE